MISLTSVYKSFGLKGVIRNITLKARSGEIIGFLGLNGAGKTTTMRLILGNLKPSKGVVNVNGIDPVTNHKEVMKSIGYLPENNPLYTDMKVDEYLRFVQEVKKAPDFQKLVEEVGIDNVITSKIEELSRGFRQRVGLAAALLGNPSVLLLDEPTSGLDPIEQEKIRKLIKSKSSKKTIIFSTHILSEVEAIATRLVVIHRGVIVYDGKKPKGKIDTLFKKLVS